MFEFFGEAVTFMNESLTFMYDGVYMVITKFFAVAFVAVTYVFYLITGLMMGLSWNIAKDIISVLNLSSVISNAWSSLDSDFLSYLTFFRVPESFNNIFSAYVTRFVMRFTVPWM